MSHSEYFLELPELETNRTFLFFQVKILQATGLPQHLSHSVFCKYSFWDQQEPVLVETERDTSSSPVSKESQCMVVFDHCHVSLFSRPGRCFIHSGKNKTMKWALLCWIVWFRYVLWTSISWGRTVAKICNVHYQQYTLNLHNVICQLCHSKAGGKNTKVKCQCI